MLLSDAVASIPQAVRMLGAFLAEDLCELRVHEVVLQSIEHGGSEMYAADGALVRAGAFVPSIGAADADLVPDGGPATAFGALHEAGNEVL